jgi:hypothetical protein
MYSSPTADVLLSPPAILDETGQFVCMYHLAYFDPRAENHRNTGILFPAGWTTGHWAMAIDRTPGGLAHPFWTADLL